MCTKCKDWEENFLFTSRVFALYNFQENINSCVNMIFYWHIQYYYCSNGYASIFVAILENYRSLLLFSECSECLYYLVCNKMFV